METRGKRREGKERRRGTSWMKKKRTGYGNGKESEKTEKGNGER